MKQTMKTCCAKCKKKNRKFRIFKTKNGRITMQSKCAVCGIKKSRYVKQQEAKGLLINLGLQNTIG